MGRTQYKGYLLKSEFCKKYGITISKFNATLLEKEILIYKAISTCVFTGKPTKYAMGIADKVGNKIRPLHGSNQQGTFQYSEKFLKIIFNIEVKPKVFNLEEYEIDFGRYKGRLINTMTSKSEIDYCNWVLNNHFINLTDEEKLVDEKYLAFKNIVK